MNRQKLSAVTVVVAILVAVITWALRPQNGPAPKPSEAPAGSSRHLLMGNPSGATDDPKATDNFLIRKPYFTISYNEPKGTANWVSWCLQTSDLGSAPRSDQFMPDSELPAGFRRIKPSDYTGSGFDRGHLCPAGDRSATPEASSATFVMTNMVPQAPDLNRKVWEKFESYCRTLARTKHLTLYIVAGPLGQGGTGSKGPADTIGNGQVTVPAKCWKVVLGIENGTGTAEDIARVGPNSRMIAVVMPNEEGLGQSWSKYRTTVREVEQLTGYKFFTNVPADVIDPLKDRKE